MERDFEQCDLGALLNIYMKETREFSSALERGASWHELKMKRLRVQAISIHLNRKYKELNPTPERRRDTGPPSEFE